MVILVLRVYNVITLYYMYVIRHSTGGVRKSCHKRLVLFYGCFEWPLSRYTAERYMCRVAVEVTRHDSEQEA